MAEHRLRILHISDLHERGKREKAEWRRRRVLGDAWEANLEAVRKDGPIDLVCLTGDLADWGDKSEYDAATSFLDALLARLDLPRDRLFVIPGNHDIARNNAPAEWARLRQHHADMGELELSEWIHGTSSVPRGFSTGDDTAILRREEAFWNWLGKDFGRAELHPSKSPHGRLGYRVQVQLPDLPFPVQIIGLDSAWAAGDNHDAKHLLLTSDQVGRLTKNDGVALPGFRLGLIHHPLTDLADSHAVTPLLADGLDLLLRGHEHRDSLEQWADPNHSLRLYAAGCLYEGDLKDQWPNAFHVIDLTLDEGGRPQRGHVWFRTWSQSGSGFWHDDNGRYPDTQDGRLQIHWVSEARKTVAPPVVFVGREAELEQLKATLLPATGTPRVAAICAVQGMAGVGKSYLADEFAARHAGAFPGGYLRLVLGPDDPRSSDELVAALGLQLVPPLQGANVVPQLVYRLQHPRTLVHVENVDSHDIATQVAGVVQQLDRCCVVLTGRIAQFGVDLGWQQIPVAPMDPGTALMQLRQELRLGAGAADPPGAKDLLDALGYLPLAIHLAASHIRDGATPTGFLALLRKRGLALRPRDAGDRGLSIDASRAILSKTFELSLDALRKEGGAEGERFVQAYAALGHAAPAGFGRSLGAAIAGLDEAEFEELVLGASRLSLLVKVEDSARPDGVWRLHALLADFLRQRVPVEEVVARMTDWFCSRLPPSTAGHEAEQGARWDAIHREVGGLVHWLPQVPDAALASIVWAGSAYAIHCGPFQAWLTFSERAAGTVFDELQRSIALWPLGNVARRTGDMDRALDAAIEKRLLDTVAGRDREAANAWGLEADILQARGRLDEAQRIWREEQLPVYERLGDVRSKAVTMGKLADILRRLGQVDEALRIHREEVLPVYERLGAIQSKAVTMGNIGDILQARGQLDEALRIRREEQLPVYEQLGDVRGKVVTVGKVADIMRVRGQADEALGLLRDEVLPALERLGDVSAAATPMGRIADILQARGQLDEALRIRKEEQLPVYERLGDVRGKAVTVGKVADILQARGQFDEALRILWEDQLPVFERLGDARGLLVCRTNIALVLAKRAHPSDRPEIANLLTQAHTSAVALRIPEADQIAKVYSGIFGKPLA